MKNLPLLIEAISQARDNPAFEPRHDNAGNLITYCNEAVKSVLHFFGCKELDGLMASQMVEYMSSRPVTWKPIDIANAQFGANQGSVLIAGLAGKDLGAAHGHVCIIRPGLPKWSPSWNMSAPSCLNIGQQNFSGLYRLKNGVRIPAHLACAFPKPPQIYGWVPSL